jgi:D-alanyl-D-alanine carboxypeptidase (penicillin-binding protein 5/6)
MTTAYDMARIAAMALENSIFRKIIVAPEYEAHDGLIWKNTSRFLKEGKYKYPYFIGGKTGYVGSAGYNLVVAAEKEGRRLIAVLLGCEKSEDRFEDAIHLFEAAFQEKPEERVLFSKGQGGFLYKEQKTACLEDAVTVSYYPSEETEWRAQLVWEVKSSSKAGKEVGRLVVMNASDVEMASAQLIAETGWKKDGPTLWVWLLLLAVLFAGGVQARKILKR